MSYFRFLWKETVSHVFEKRHGQMGGILIQEGKAAKVSEPVTRAEHGESQEIAQNTHFRKFQARL